MQIRLRSFLLALAFSATAGTARADVSVSGSPASLHVEANNAPIVEVLEALKRQCGMVYDYRGSPNWAVDGTFSGSLPSILSMIFQGKDYAFRIGPDNSVVVFMLAPQGSPADVTAPPPPVAAVMLGEPPPSQPAPSAKELAARHLTPRRRAQIQQPQ